MLKNNKMILAFTSVFTGVILTGSILIASASYFNNKEIDSLTSQCYQNDGEPALTIHNQLTHNYSFQCNSNEI